MGNKIPEDVLAEEVTRLRGLLRKYGEHMPACWYAPVDAAGNRPGLPCSCGWADVEHELESDG